MGPIYTSSTAALRRAFDIFDADGNGSIDRDEFSSIMHRLHLLPRDDEAAAEKALAQMFDVADIDHDGTVSFEEFCAMFHQHVGAPSSSAKPITSKAHESLIFLTFNERIHSMPVATPSIPS